MNISLTPELKSLVNNKVKTGLYNSASEVVREALRLLEEQDRIKEIRLEELRKEIIKAEEQIKSGQFREIRSEMEMREFGESLVRQGHERLAAIHKAE